MIWAYSLSRRGPFLTNLFCTFYVITQLALVLLASARQYMATTQSTGSQSKWNSESRNSNYVIFSETQALPHTFHLRAPERIIFLPLLLLRFKMISTSESHISHASWETKRDTKQELQQLLCLCPKRSLDEFVFIRGQPVSKKVKHFC